MHATGSGGTPTCCVPQKHDWGGWGGFRSFLYPTKTYFPIIAQCVFPHISKVKSLFLKARFPSSSEAESVTFELQGTIIIQIG